MFNLNPNRSLQRFRILISIFIISLVLFSCSTAQVPAGTLKFPEGKDRVEIPFERDRGWIIIKVRVNSSRELSFILDSGAPVAVLVNDKLADQLNLNMRGNISVKGSDGNAARSVPLARNVKFNINGIEIINGLMAIGATSSAVSGIDGIIGKYLFDDAVVQVDWKKNKLIVIRPEKFSYQGNGEVLRVTATAGGHFYTDVTVQTGSNSIVSKADIDIGNVSSYFWIHKSTVNNLTENTRQLSNIITGWGANGPSYGNVARTSLQIGSAVLDSVVTVFKDASPGKEIDGNIGINLLERFDLIFDYPQQQLILEKNETFSAPFTFNRSGIILNPVYEKEYVIIADIIAGSPANDEALQKGDKIFSINGIKISQLTGSKIKEFILGANSNEVVVEVKEGDILSARKIKMRRLI